MVSFVRHTGISFYPQLGLIDSGPTLKVRHARSLSWQDIGHDAPLYLHDTLATPTTGTSKIRVYAPKAEGEPQDALLTHPKDPLPTQVVELPPNSLIRLETSGSSSIAFTLLASSGHVWHPHIKRSVQERFVEVTAIEDRFQDLSRRHQQLVRAKIAAPRLKALRPDLALDQLRFYDLVVLGPQNKTYPLSATHWLEMRWTPIPIPGVKYTVLIDRDPTFANFLTHSTLKNTLQIQFETAGKYFWKVRAQLQGQFIVSGVHQFALVSKEQSGDGLWNKLDSQTDPVSSESSRATAPETSRPDTRTTDSDTEE